MTSTDDDYMFMCEHCAMPFSYFAQYKSHGVNCDYSPSTSEKSSSATKTDSIDYNCSYCKGRFENFPDFLSHFQKMGKQRKCCLDTQKTRLGSNDVCVCVLCGFSAKRSNLLNHLHADHENLLKNRQKSSIFKFCPMCTSFQAKNPGRFLSFIDFLHHVSTFHPAAIFLTKKSPPENGNSRDKLVGCPSCEMFFLDNELEQHISDLHGEKCSELVGNGKNSDLGDEIPTRKRRIDDFDVENEEVLAKKRSLEKLKNRRRLLLATLTEQAFLVRARTSSVRRRLAGKEVFRSILRENAEKKCAADSVNGRRSLKNAKITPPGGVSTKYAMNGEPSLQNEPIFKCSYCCAEFKSAVTLSAHREIIHPMGVPLKLFLNRAKCSPSTFRLMLSYFYRQISDGKSSNLRQFRLRREATYSETSATKSLWMNESTAAAPTFSSMNDYLVRQRVNGRPVAVEFPLSFDQQNGNPQSTIASRNSNELAAKFARTPPAAISTSERTSPPPTFRKLSPPSDVNTNGGRRLVIVKGTPSLALTTSNKFAAGITITAASKIRTSPPTATKKRAGITIGDRTNIFVRTGTSSSLSNITRTPSNQISVPATTASSTSHNYSISSFSSQKRLIVSKSTFGNIILNVSKPFSTVQGNRKISDDIIIE